MKKGYTLSEVMVVLAVLGVIAAFVIPAINKTAPDKSEMMFKKSFFSMQEAASRLINDSTLYDDGTANHHGWFSDWSGTDDFCNKLAAEFNTIGNINCSSAGSAAAPNFVTTNGAKWWNVYSAFANTDKNTTKDVNVDCGGTVYKIRIYNDGRVGTDSAWTTENTILQNAIKLQKQAP